MKFNLFQYLLIFLVIGAVSFAVTPLFRKIARRAKILDYPGGRKLQASPVSYLGGLAVTAPITLGSLLVVFTSISSDIKNQFFLGLILPSLAIAFIGLLDDLYQLPPWPRFVAQSGVGVITSLMLYLSDGGVKLFDNPWINGALTSLWVVTMINALNFMDNMDGLATSLSIIISLSLFILSYLNSQYLVAALCMAVVAACIGFLFWNRRPASIYLGDAGALYLGFLLAAISIRVDVNSDTEIIRVLVPLLIFAIPVIDITQVVISRVTKGKSPFEGGRDHLSHLLLSKGLSEGKALMLLTTSALFLALIGVFLAVGN
jgi:UDP-GlcNAc:undecaprenyl-phosphate/decaprenyl-phosphate GlcNAc-1-phosphate transferase